MDDHPTQGHNRGFATRAVHATLASEVTQVPSSVPLYQTSLWRFNTLDEFADVIGDKRPGHVYGRGYGNPTVEAFERLMADLAQTEAAFGFDSGMAAIHTVVTALATSGDHVVASRELYGGTYSLFTHLLPRYGITTRFVDSSDLDAVAEALPGARLFFVETIANPVLRVPDLRALGNLCHEAGVPGVIDNTFATPRLCNPVHFGFELVVHSATKYIGGHSDLIGGVVCTSAERRQTLREIALDTGGAMQPLEAWLCLRGLVTLDLRMRQQCASAMALAELLSGTPEAGLVHYPGLPNDPSHHMATGLLDGYGGMVAFEHNGGLEGAHRFCDSLKLVWVAGSLGGSHSLVAHPASTTHRQLDPEARRMGGISDGLVRISVGLEDLEDLQADVRQALANS
jgi:cystathionine beta-lyase/cystathionine gamma-synthase